MSSNFLSHFLMCFPRCTNFSTNLLNLLKIEVANLKINGIKTHAYVIVLAWVQKCTSYAVYRLKFSNPVVNSTITTPRTVQWQKVRILIASHAQTQPEFIVIWFSYLKWLLCCLTAIIIIIIIINSSHISVSGRNFSKLTFAVCGGSFNGVADNVFDVWHLGSGILYSMPLFSVYVLLYAIHTVLCVSQHSATMLESYRTEINVRIEFNFIIPLILGEIFIEHDKFT